MKEKHKRMHEQMITYQDHISPFTPTVRELVELWDGINSTSAAHYILSIFEREGKVIVRSVGSSKKYYAVV